MAVRGLKLRWERLGAIHYDVHTDGKEGQAQVDACGRVKPHVVVHTEN